MEAGALCVMLSPCSELGTSERLLARQVCHSPNDPPQWHPLRLCSWQRRKARWPGINRPLVRCIDRSIIVALMICLLCMYTWVVMHASLSVSTAVQCSLLPQSRHGATWLVNDLNVLEIYKGGNSPERSC
eukprot:2675718-Amphidinium_carterae.1